PVDSETELANDSETARKNFKFVEEMAMAARDSAKHVFDNYWTAGQGAEAAAKAYKKAAAAKFDEAEGWKVAWPLLARASSDVERTKRLMGEENTAAHHEAETFLRSGSGQSIAQIAALLSKHRAAIQAQSVELHGHVANDTMLFISHFPATPG